MGIITFDGPVTEIGDHAFYGRTTLTSISLPNSITAIGWSSFANCSALSSIDIPISVSSIGNYAFSSTDIKSIIIPNGVPCISQGTFQYCGQLSTIVIPESVTSIEAYAFEECTSLTNIIIPDGVTSIGVEAFHYCRLLSSLSIPNSVTSIGAGAFDDCSRITSIIISNNVTCLEDHVFSGCSSLTSIVIPNSVTTIKGGALSGCHSLTNVVIPNSVTTIGYEAFACCSSLTSINIPESVTSITNGAFCSCGSLISISVDAGNTKYDSRNECNAIIETDSGMLIRGCKNTIIPHGVTIIGNDSFCGCSDLTSILIPDSVTIIGGDAFGGCVGLASITIPESVTGIGESAFRRCRGLTEIVCLRDTPPEGDEDMFYDTNDCPIYVPSYSLSAYKSAEYWNDYSSRIQAIPSAGEINGHSYVEMGNGLKWATMNVGANSPEESGDYFAWGETISKTRYSWSNYAHGTSLSNISKYNEADGTTILEDLDDAAHVNWGGTWRMPTNAEWRALFDTNNFDWTWDESLKGYIVTSKVPGYKGNRIILPAAGACDGTNLLGEADFGNYWSSSLDITMSSSAWSVNFYSNLVSWFGYDRYRGHTIRPVSD